MPVPSPTYFPRSLQERAAWFANFILNFPVALAVGLGFTAAEHDAMVDDNADFQSIAATTLAAEGFMSALRQFRISLTEDPVGTPAPMFPAENFTAPPNEVPAGIFQRLIENVARIRAAPAYTDELGALLGILPSPTPPPDNFFENPPTFKAKAQPGNVVIVEFVRGQSNGIIVEIQIDDETEWKLAKQFNKSPGTIQVAANGALPRAVRLRARYLQGNDPTGNYSDTVNIVTVP